MFNFFLPWEYRILCKKGIWIEKKIWPPPRVMSQRPRTNAPFGNLIVFTSVNVYLTLNSDSNYFKKCSGMTF